MIKLKGFAYEPVDFMDTTYDDGIGYNGPGWYYWNETWSHVTGPYPSYTEALANLLEYCDTFLGE